MMIPFSLFRKKYRPDFLENKPFSLIYKKNHCFRYGFFPGKRYIGNCHLFGINI